MSQVIIDAKEQLKTLIADAFKAAMDEGQICKAEIPAFVIEVPNDRSHGDWACNAAMVSAKTFRMPPRKIAEAVSERLRLEESCFQKYEIAGPGFLNFYYKPEVYAKVLQDVLQKQGDYGRSGYGRGERVMVEFVSANPTGPMHIGNARGGMLGDCLASVMDAAGFDVYREFYVNDAGNQLEKLAMSLDIRYRQLFETENPPELPEDSYHGEDIKAHVKAYADAYGDKLMKCSEEERKRALAEYVLPKNIAKMKADMAKYGVIYDKWFHESSLHRSGAVDAVVDILRKKGLTYEKEGALWYKATELGAEKDEVLIRSNGKPTYFTVDVAYHRDKFQRGFSRLIDCWGADHHGHVARMKTAMNAIGEDGGKLDIVLYQMVNLMQDGKIVRMSKRTGKTIQLSDLLDEVSLDSARFLFSMHEPNVAMDFDLDLAVKQDAQNPVYYVQYAHARICSILRNLEADGISFTGCTQEELMLLNAPEEIELVRHIAGYTDEVIRAARAMDPSHITKYVMNLSTLFHKFYNTCRVKGIEESLMRARLCLCICTRIVIRNILDLMKVSAPDSM